MKPIFKPQKKHPSKHIFYTGLILDNINNKTVVGANMPVSECSTILQIGSVVHTGIDISCYNRKLI
jgi:hypothetical protein